MGGSQLTLRDFTKGTLAIAQTVASHWSVNVDFETRGRLGERVVETGNRWTAYRR